MTEASKKKLLIVLPDYPLPAFLKLLGGMQAASPKRGWGITVLGHRADDHNQPIRYPKGVEVIPFDAPRKSGEVRLNYLRRSVLAFGQHLMRIGNDYDLVFSPCSHWLMIDDFTLRPPLVAYMGDFTFETLLGESFYRIFFWETTWRIGERAARVLFHDDFTCDYAEKEYHMSPERLRILWKQTPNAFFDTFDEVLQ